MVLSFAFCFVLLNAHASLFKMLNLSLAPSLISERSLVHISRLSQRGEIVTEVFGIWTQKMTGNAEGPASLHVFTVAGVTGLVRPV